MLPLLIPGIVSLANNAVEAWKTHGANKVAAQTAQGAEFQEALNKATATAATQLTALAAKQQAEQFSGQVETLTRQILQTPEVQAHTRGGSVQDFKIDKNGNLFVLQPGGGLQRIPVSAEGQARVDQLNALQRAQPATAAAPVQFMANSGAQIQASFSAI